MVTLSSFWIIALETSGRERTNSRSRGSFECPRLPLRRRRICSPASASRSCSFNPRAAAFEADALDAVLPFDRRDLLAGILTDDDVATLRHLGKEGIGENSLRALASDLSYLEAWRQAATSAPLPWRPPRQIKFVAHHLWDPAKRETDRSHGMPQSVAEI